MSLDVSLQQIVTIADFDLYLRTNVQDLDSSAPRMNENLMIHVCWKIPYSIHDIMSIGVDLMTAIREWLRATFSDHHEIHLHSDPGAQIHHLSLVCGLQEFYMWKSGRKLVGRADFDQKLLGFRQMNAPWGRRRS